MKKIIISLFGLLSFGVLAKTDDAIDFITKATSPEKNNVIQLNDILLEKVVIKDGEATFLTAYHLCIDNREYISFTSHDPILQNVLDGEGKPKTCKSPLLTRNFIKND